MPVYSSGFEASSNEYFVDGNYITVTNLEMAVERVRIVLSTYAKTSGISGKVLDKISTVKIRTNS
jgi:hypothetical protein